MLQRIYVSTIKDAVSGGVKHVADNSRQQCLCWGSISRMCIDGLLKMYDAIWLSICISYNTLHVYVEETFDPSLSCIL